MEEPDSATKRVAERVRALRKSNGLSGARLAQLLADHGVGWWSRTTVAKLETGRRRHITVTELEALADALRVPIASFLRSTCTRCYDNPPAGFTCNTCRAVGDTSS